MMHRARRPLPMSLSQALTGTRRTPDWLRLTRKVLCPPDRAWPQRHRGPENAGTIQLCGYHTRATIRRQAKSTETRRFLLCNTRHPLRLSFLRTEESISAEWGRTWFFFVIPAQACPERSRTGRNPLLSAGSLDPCVRRGDKTGRKDAHPVFAYFRVLWGRCPQTPGI